MTASFDRPVHLGYRFIQLVAILTFFGLLYTALFIPQPPPPSHPIACHRLIVSFYGIAALGFFGPVCLAYDDYERPKWASIGAAISMAWFMVWFIAMFVDIFTN